VTTLKNTVDHVVTEYGIAKLRGRSIADRARALVEIAHPDHREALERDATEFGLVPSVNVRQPSSRGRKVRPSAPSG
jgi:acyl-CoA hydrolase